MSTHPLTDEIIWTMWGKGDCSQKFENRLARSAADWQLEQVIKFMEEHEPMFGGSGAIFILKDAMRPQEDNQ